MTAAPTPIRGQNGAKPMPEIEEKTVPHDNAAEASVVASIMVDEQALERIADMLAPSDFFRDEHAWTYAAALALRERGETVNQVTVAHELSRAGHLDGVQGVGGLSWLSQLVNDLPTPIGVEHYAGIVRRDATYRALIGIAQQVVKDAYAGGPDLDAVLERAERNIRAVSAMRDTSAETRSVAELLDAWWENPGIDSGGPLANCISAIRSGMRDVDALTAGFAPSNLVIVAAQTSIGKSTFLLNVARNAARAQNMRTVLFSLEMSRDEWTVRLLSRESGLESRRLRLGQMTEDEERRTMTATADLHPLPIDVHDQPGIRVDQMRNVLRALRHKRQGVDLVLVDYLQLVHGSGRQRDNRVAEVTEISRGLKEMAREFEVPVVAAAQLSRKVDERTPPRPRLSDLRESGSIEQDADIVILLTSLKAFGNKYTIPGWLVDVAKNRNGPTGECIVGVQHDTGRTWDVGEPEEEA